MIHNTLFFILAGLTIILVLSLFFCAIAQESDLSGCVLIIGFIFVIIGWGMFGHLWPAINLQREVAAQVLKTDKSIIFILDGQPVKTVTDIVNYKYFENKTNAILIQGGSVDIYCNTNWANYYTIKD